VDDICKSLQEGQQTDILTWKAESIWAH
jgi:hypothetical protein